MADIESLGPLEGAGLAAPFGGLAAGPGPTPPDTDAPPGAFQLVSLGSPPSGGAGGSPGGVGGPSGGGSSGFPGGGSPGGGTPDGGAPGNGGGGPNGSPGGGPGGGGYEPPPGGGGYEPPPGGGASGAPEPASWTMMLLGVGLVGARVRWKVGGRRLRHMTALP